MQNAINKLLKSAVIWSFLGTGLRMAGLVLVLPLMLRMLPSEQLGLWYVFLAFGAMVPLLDAGFSPTAIRTVGYIWAGAEKLLAFGYSETPGNDGKQTNWKLLSEVVNTMRVFYRVLSLVILILLGMGGGVWIWKQTQGMSSMWLLRGAWVFYVGGLAVNVWGSVWTCMLTGINQVRPSQQIFVLAVILNYVVTAVGVIEGWGIWALVTGQIVYGLVIRTLGRKVFLKIVGHHIDRKIPANVGLLKTMWPMAWRTGLILVGSFLIVQANTIICGSRLGLKETASFGLSMQLISALVGVSAVWIGVKGPFLNQLRAQGKITELIFTFSQRLKFCVITYFFGAIFILFLGPSLVMLVGSKTELLPFPLLLLLLIFMFLEMHHSQYGSLVLTENQNPFVFPALISGFFVVGLSWFSAPVFGVLGIICSFGFVQLSFNNWWTVWRGINGLGISVCEYVKLFFRAKLW